MLKYPSSGSSSHETLETSCWLTLSSLNNSLTAFLIRKIHTHTDISQELSHTLSGSQSNGDAQ